MEAHHGLRRARPLRWCTSPSTTSTAPAASATRSSPGRRALSASVMQLDGKTVNAIDPDDASHTFTIPQMGIVVPIEGVPDDAKNPCDEVPCSLDKAHETITFTFRTGKPGTTAGSASCRARPASSTGSAGRCRRSATWTASCTWSEPRTASQSPPHFGRIADPVGRAQHHRDADRRPRVGARPAAGQRPPARRRGRSPTTPSCSALVTPISSLIVVYFVYTLIVFRRREDETDEGLAIRGDTGRPDDLAGRDLGDRAVPGELRHRPRCFDEGSGGGQGPSRSSSHPGDQAAGTGDRPAVGVHLPVPVLRRSGDLRTW